jgi:hypothetical protein
VVLTAEEAAPHRTLEIATHDLLNLRTRWA